MLSCLQALHEKDMVHRNVCPENFLVDQNGKIYLIDFAYVTKIDPTERYPTDIEPKSDPLYHSLNSLDGRSYSYKDDLESLGYCFIEFAMAADRHFIFNLNKREEKKSLTNLTDGYAWIKRYIEAVRQSPETINYHNLKEAISSLEPKRE